MRPCGWRLSLSCSKQQRAQDRFQHIASGEHWSVAMDRSGNHNLSVEFKFLCRCRTVFLVYITRIPEGQISYR